MRVRRLVPVIFLLTLGGWLYYEGADGIRDFGYLFYGTPHERYAASLRRSGLAQTAPGRIWIESAGESLKSARPLNLPGRDLVSFPSDEPRAAAFVVALRRGQRYVADIVGEDAGMPRVFVDLFERDGEAVHVVRSASSDESRVVIEIRSDGEYVIRVQPELHRDVRITLVQRTEPTLRLPVEDAKPADIQSAFGAARDEGARTHEGVDIFATRGTSVLAAADGIVSSVRTNGLGGNVVWIARPGWGEAHYYAHLDTQLVTAGARVRKGDVIGTVGNTGNARTTAPHLHFGIYTSRGAVDPFPYISNPRPARRRASAATHPSSTKESYRGKSTKFGGRRTILK